MDTTDTQLRNLLRDVYKQVWQEFYAWELGYSTSSIALLAQNQTEPIPIDPPAVKSLQISVDTGTSGADLTQDADTNMIPDPDALILYDLEGGSYATLISMQSVEVESIIPQTQYESAAPLHCNIRHGDDSNDMPFIPYADSDFDWQKNVLEYSRFAWQHGRQNPDRM